MILVAITLCECDYNGTSYTPSIFNSFAIDGFLLVNCTRTPVSFSLLLLLLLGWIIQTSCAAHYYPVARCKQKAVAEEADHQHGSLDRLANVRNYLINQLVNKFQQFVIPSTAAAVAAVRSIDRSSQLLFLSDVLRRDSIVCLYEAVQRVPLYWS